VDLNNGHFVLGSNVVPHDRWARRQHEV
jgi:hypothetical protein